MDVYAKICEIARRNEHNRRAITHVYLSKNGKPYEFDDYGKLRGEYLGNISCNVPMPPEFEEQVALSGD